MVKRGHRCTGPKHQKEKRSMDHFAGLDVSVKDTSVCIVDGACKIVREVKVAIEPDALLQVLTNPIYCFKRIGLEAGPLSQWLFSALGEANLPVFKKERQATTVAFEVEGIGEDRRGNADKVDPGIGTTRMGQRIFECVLSIGTRSAQSIMASGFTAAQTGRTHDRTRPMLQRRQKVLAKAPSTSGGPFISIYAIARGALRCSQRFVPFHFPIPTVKRNRPGVS